MYWSQACFFSHKCAELPHICLCVHGCILFIIDSIISFLPVFTPPPSFFFLFSTREKTEVCHMLVECLIIKFFDISVAIIFLFPPSLSVYSFIYIFKLKIDFFYTIYPDYSFPPLLLLVLPWLSSPLDPLSFCPSLGKNRFLSITTKHDKTKYSKTKRKIPYWRKNYLITWKPNRRERVSRAGTRTRESLILTVTSPIKILSNSYSIYAEDWGRRHRPCVFCFSLWVHMSLA